MIADSNILIEARDLMRVYGDGEEIRALDHVNFSRGRAETWWRLWGHPAAAKAHCST